MRGRRNGRWLLLVAALACSTAASSGENAPVGHPGPPHGPPALRLKQNRNCGGCHTEIFKEWERSWHHLSFINREFQEARLREPSSTRPFCVSCHAPEARPDVSDGAEERQVGVTCVTCHVPETDILAAPNGTFVSAERSTPHPVLRTATLREVEGCSECHEFKYAANFPYSASESAQWMQRTAHEHYEGRANDETCVTCHMPLEGAEKPHHSHRFLAGHSESVVRDSLRVEVSRPNAQVLRVVLTPREVTHAVPTGDLYRRIAIYVTPQNSSPTKGPYVRFLARHHGRIERGVRRELSDDRPFQSPSVVDIELGTEVLRDTVKYRVVYERVAYLRGDDERNAVVSSEIVLSQGTLKAETWPWKAASP